LGKPGKEYTFNDFLNYYCFALDILISDMLGLNYGKCNELSYSPSDQVQLFFFPLRHDEWLDSKLHDNTEITEWDSLFLH